MHNNRCQKVAAKLLFGRGRPAKERLRRLFRLLDTNLPNHSKQLIAVCGLSLHIGSSESRKTLGKKIIFDIGTLNLHGINERFSFN